MRRELAKLTAGISLTDLNVLIQSARESGKRLDSTVFRALKKRLLERQCHGLLEFIEPRWTLDTVVGHDARQGEAARRRCAPQARRARHVADGLSPVRSGWHRQVVPRAVSSAARSRPRAWCSRTSGRSMSAKPRATSNACSRCCARWGRSSSSSTKRTPRSATATRRGTRGRRGRVFGMIAAQMGDTQYRGSIIWMLLTARPDSAADRPQAAGARGSAHPALLSDRRARDPADVRHPREEARIALAPRTCRRFRSAGTVGRDIEGMVGPRVAHVAAGRRRSRDARALAGRAQFMPSTQGLERELQETAAILECTDRQFQPPADSREGGSRGRAWQLQARLTALKQIVKISETEACDGTNDWFDDKAEHPLIHEQIERLESFTTRAGGRARPRSRKLVDRTAARRGDEGLEPDLTTRCTRGSRPFSSSSPPIT
jgi:hypothetical protein